METQQEKFGRRESDNFYARLSVVELGVAHLKNDVVEHKEMTQRMCDTLDGIRQEMSAGKGFMKATVVLVGAFVAILGALVAVQWLKIPMSG